MLKVQNFAFDSTTKSLSQNLVLDIHLFVSNQQRKIGITVYCACVADWFRVQIMKAIKPPHIANTKQFHSTTELFANTIWKVSPSKQMKLYNTYRFQYI